MKKLKEEKLKPFSSKITPDNKKKLREYAAKKDLKLFEAFNEVLDKSFTCRDE